MRVKDSAIHLPRVAFHPPRLVVAPGFGWAALGVLAFSGTFPATHVALEGFSPGFVGAGRSVVAAIGAALCLFVGKAKVPRRTELPGFVVIACCVGFGFGLISAITLRSVGVAASGIVVGLLPIATAIIATWRFGERPSPVFWIASFAGAALVVGFLLSRGGGSLSADDLLLLVAVIIAAVGYAEGGRLSKLMPGWQVICWALLLSLPVTLPIATYSAIESHPHPGVAAMTGFLYVSFFSMLFGFFAWNRGLAMAGIARASQVQLAQPLLTLGWAALLFGESISVAMLGVAVGVVACVAITQRVRISSSRNGRRPAREGVDREGSEVPLLAHRTHQQ